MSIHSSLFGVLTLNSYKLIYMENIGKWHTDDIYTYWWGWKSQICQFSLYPTSTHRILISSLSVQNHNLQSCRTPSSIHPIHTPHNLIPISSILLMAHKAAAAFTTGPNPKRYSWFRSKGSLAPIEDSLYVWKCPQAEASSLWSSSLTSLITWMERCDTDPDINAVCSHLDAWQYDRATPAMDMPNESKDAVEPQSSLGW